MEQQLIITVNSVDFGLPINRVTSIEKVTPSTPIPMMPEYVSGLVSIREGILPIFDMNMILYSTKTTLCDTSRFVLIENEGQQLALLVDEAKEIVSHSADEIMALQSVNVEGIQIFDGVLQTEAGLVSLINIARFLNSLTDIDYVRSQITLHSKNPQGDINLV